MLVIALDRDVAGHVAVALRRHRGSLAERGLVEPPGLAALENLARSVYSGHEQSPSVGVPAGLDDGSRERDYLTRSDIRQRTGASLSTVDRWIRTGQLPSVKRGRTRRVSREDLVRFLAA